MSQSLVFLNLQKYDFIQMFLVNRSFFVKERVNRSFFVKERVIHSEKTNDLLRLLFCPERPERFSHSRSEQIAHGCSFLVSNLSDLLTVTLLS